MFTVASATELGFSGKGGFGLRGVGGGPIGTVDFDIEGSGSVAVVVAGALGGGGPMVVVMRGVPEVRILLAI